MIKNEYILNVDLKKKHSAITPTFVQYDTAVLRFIITDDGKPLYFTDQTSIKTYHRRIDGIVVEGEATLEIVKGQPQIVYEYQGNEMYQLGFVETSLVIYTGNKKVSIQPFKVKIVDNIYDDTATPSNPEYGALQNLVVSVEDLIDRAVTATDKANAAAEIVQSTVIEWKYVSTHDMSVSYKKNNVVSYNGSTFVAIKDNVGSIPVGNLSDANWRIMARKGENGEGLVVLHKKDFVATLNQTDFTLPYEYDQHQGRVRVIIDGVEQFTPENFVELSSTKVRMNSALRKDANVKVIYFGNAPALKNDVQLQIDNINKLLANFNLAEANTAITHATTQGDYAKTQGDYAKTQGASVSTSVTQANAARDSANTAASSANTAATNANSAKDAATTATNKANTATALAETATTNANQAKTDAISAANDANIAKNSANQAAALANDAVANMSPKGEYSPTTSYLPRNIVSYLGNSYMNIVACKGILPTDTTKWQPAGGKGDKGDNGFGFTWKKEYNVLTAYIKDDVVYYNGSSFIALKSVKGITPTNDNINWNIITQRGLDGTGSVSSVNGISPDLNGNVTIPTVTSVNNQTGAINGLATDTSVDNKVGTKIDKSTINKPSGVAGLDTYGNLSSDIILDTASQQTLTQTFGDFRNHRTDSSIHVTLTKKNEWDAKETTTGAQAKATKALADSQSYTDNKIGVLNDGLIEHKAVNTTNAHKISNITGLQSALDSKSTFSGNYVDLTNKPASFPPSAHVHTTSDVNGLQAALNEKADALSVGNLSSLTTTDKTSLVKAINEINAKPSGGGSEEYKLVQTIKGEEANFQLTNINGLQNYKKVKLIFKRYGRDLNSAVTSAYTMVMGIGTGVSTSNNYTQLSQIGSPGAATTMINLISVGAKSTSQKLVYGQVEIFLESAPYSESTLWNTGDFSSTLGGETVENFTKVIGYRKYSDFFNTPSYIWLQHTGMAIGTGTLEIWGVPR